MIVVEYAAPVSLLGRDPEANVTSSLSHEATMNDQNEHTTIGVSKLITILAEAESQVVFVRSTFGLMTIERT